MYLDDLLFLENDINSAVNPPVSESPIKKMELPKDISFYKSKITDINWAAINEEQFLMGLDIELEHGSKHPETNITNDDPILTAKIALAHLFEIKDYYSRLQKMEEDAKIVQEGK
jgi:hypothetical protein